jgi:hypothetical protein
VLMHAPAVLSLFLFLDRFGLEVQAAWPV